MKASHILIILLVLIAALTAGWFIESRPTLSIKAPLQVPDNIDYYLAEVSLRSYDDSGAPRYQLQSPYLEHYIREDLSRIDQPDIHYFAKNNQWQITADKGSLLHQNQVFSLSQQARLQRIDPLNPMLLTSDLMIFTPDTEQVEIPQALRIETNDLKLLADSATMDIKNNRHEFHRVKATYQQDK